MKPDSKKSRKRPAKKARKKTQKNMWKEGNITGKVVSNEKAKAVARQLKTLQILDIKKELNVYVPASNQYRSGRCWMFSYLNGLRLSLISHYKLPPTFSLSASYMMFWDKYEKCNYFLHRASHYSKESMDHIDNHFLYRTMISDGGTWNMIQNIVEKYGVVSYDAMKESYHSMDTDQMNDVLFNVLKRGARELRQQPKSKHGAIIKRQMKKIRGFLVKCAGRSPPTQVACIKDPKKKCSPTIWYETDVKPLPGNDVQKKVVLVHVPHLDENQYYTIQELNNMEGGKQIYYFNVSTRNLKKAILHQLTNHIPVWFGCDVDKFHHKDEALLDNKVFSYDSFPFSKQELFLQKTNAIPYYQTNINHAMLFTGYYYKASQKQTPLYWLVENSHSSKMKRLSFEDNHGNLTMYDSWFDSYMLMAVVDENALQQDTLASKIRDKDNVKILPKWSNLGELLFQ